MIRQLASFTKGYKKILLSSFMFGLLAFLAQLGLIYLAFDIFLYQYFNMGALLWLLGFAILIGLGRYLEQYLGHLVAFKLLSHLRNLVYKKLRFLAPSKLDHAQSGDLLKIINTDIEMVEVFFAHTLVPVSMAIVYTILVNLYAGTVVGLKALFVLFSYIFIGAILPFYKRKTITEGNVKIGQIKNEVRQNTIEIISGHRELKQLFQYKDKIYNLDENMYKEYVIQKKNDIIMYNKQMYSFTAIALFSAAWFFLIHNDIAANPKLILLALVFPLSFDPLIALTTLSTSLNKSLLSAKNLLGFLNEKELVSSTSNEELKEIKSIDFVKTDFAYPKTDKDVFKNLNLSIKEGESIGISGHSGIGKSSLVKLIMRWYDIKGGELLINGQSYKNYNLDSLRKEVNYLPQQPYIFETTLKENISLGKDIKDDDIWKWLRELKLDDKVAKLDGGLDCKVSPEKPLLSSGEWQRIELIRSLMHPSSVLVLDEPTSNLDMENEKLILELIHKHYKGIKIIISHSPSSFAYCDRIINFEEIMTK